MGNKSFSFEVSQFLLRQSSLELFQQPEPAVSLLALHSLLSSFILPNSAPPSIPTAAVISHPSAVNQPAALLLLQSSPPLIQLISPSAVSFGSQACNIYTSAGWAAIATPLSLLPPHSVICLAALFVLPAQPSILKSRPKRSLSGGAFIWPTLLTPRNW